MRVAWTGDLHMGFWIEHEEAKFVHDVKKAHADILLVAGDIAEARTIKKYLIHLSNLAQTVYFVLGNHDYYTGSIAETRKEVHAFLTTVPNLHWMNECGVVKLTPDVALIGHDGWADGRFGWYERSHVELNDFKYIKELKLFSKAERLYCMQSLANEAAEHFSKVLLETGWAKHIIVLTHVPPWDKATWHQGQQSDGNYLPFFSSKVVGQVLESHMTEHLNQKMTVLCGHTHGGGKAQIAPNLVCLTGDSEYHNPKVEKTLEI